MGRRIRKRHGAGFKAKVALAAAKGAEQRSCGPAQSSPIARTSPCGLQSKTGLEF